MEDNLSVIDRCRSILLAEDSKQKITFASYVRKTFYAFVSEQAEMAKKSPGEAKKGTESTVINFRRVKEKANFSGF